jgi:hypothetical protein
MPSLWQEHRMLINGEPVAAADGTTYANVNPATEASMPRLVLMHLSRQSIYRCPMPLGNGARCSAPHVPMSRANIRQGLPPHDGGRQAFHLGVNAPRLLTGAKAWNA